MARRGRGQEGGGVARRGVTSWWSPPLRLLRAGGRPGRRGHEQGGEAAAGKPSAGNV